MSSASAWLTRAHTQAQGGWARPPTWRQSCGVRGVAALRLPHWPRRQAEWPRPRALPAPPPARYPKIRGHSPEAGSPSGGHGHLWRSTRVRETQGPLSRGDGVLGVSPPGPGPRKGTRTPAPSVPPEDLACLGLGGRGPPGFQSSHAAEPNVQSPAPSRCSAHSRCIISEPHPGHMAERLEGGTRDSLEP